MEADGTIENIYRKHNLSLSRFEIDVITDVDFESVGPESEVSPRNTTGKSFSK
jgi:hypothetical protein